MRKLKNFIKNTFLFLVIFSLVGGGVYLLSSLENEDKNNNISSTTKTNEYKNLTGKILYQSNNENGNCRVLVFLGGLDDYSNLHHVKFNFYKDDCLVFGARSNVYYTSIELNGEIKEISDFGYDIALYHETSSLIVNNEYKIIVDVYVENDIVYSLERTFVFMLDVNNDNSSNDNSNNDNSTIENESYSLKVNLDGFPVSGEIYYSLDESNVWVLVPFTGENDVMTFPLNREFEKIQFKVLTYFNKNTTSDGSYSMTSLEISFNKINDNYIELYYENITASGNVEEIHNDNMFALSQVYNLNEISGKTINLKASGISTVTI